MPNYNITDLIQGNDYSLTFQAKDVNNNPIDLTSYNILSIIKESYSTPTGIASFSGNIVTPASGICQVSLSHQQTSGLPIQTYVYYIRAINNSNVFDLLNGYLNVNPFN